MKTSLNRRTFLKHAALSAGALSATGWFPGPNLLAVQDAGRKLDCVQIGCGGRGLSAHLEWLVRRSKDNVVAIVDPDERRHAEVKRFLQRNQLDPSRLQTFTDYRVMFDQLGKSLDAVFIATPNHHHAPPAMLAIQLGKAVFCEKPLCHDIAQARKLRQMARESKAPTQMGNQGHCESGYRRLCEFVWGGVVGNITQTYSWTDRANGAAGRRPPSLPVPAGLHWDEWLGPAPFRDYHAGLHPHDWHGWYDFGNGSLGNMGCHVLDGVFWALKVEHPASVEAEEIRPGSNEAYPTGCRLRYDIPARADMPPLTAYWYEGLKLNAQTAAKGSLQSAQGKDQNLPPLFDELLRKYPDEGDFDRGGGTFYVGEKGILYTGTYGSMHVLPRERMSEFSQVPKTLPRPKDIMTDFLEACREGRKETAASFEYGAQLTEFTLLGNLAQYAGAGCKVQWDGPNMKAANLPGLDRWLKQPSRPGWPSC
jgi:predicted dehydrogenase